MSDAPAKRPTEDALEGYPLEFQRELYSFCGALIFKLLQVGLLDAPTVVGMIREAIEEARTVFVERGMIEFKRWWEDEGQFANAVEATVVDGNFLTLIPVQDTRGGKQLVESEHTWGGTTHVHVYTIPEVDPLPESELGESPDYWRHRLRQLAAEYVATHNIQPRNPLGRDFPVGPDLILESGVPTRLPADEEAVMIANRLTGLGNPDRLRYRMKLLRGDGPYIPAALLEDVAAKMITSTATARRNLIKGGFELPEDLTYVLTSPRKAT
ncbi:hypothetical protein [Rubrivirga sp.]|uniref:hypothetical protein n=1 Tax=Rubrivirga sp. TaxID=1885344 RepID=UPI003B524B84